MSHEVGQDHLAIIRIEGMHCAKCEKAIQRALTASKGVHEVEVDFASGQASVLFDPSHVKISTMMTAINAVGYRAAGFSEREIAPPK